MWTLQTPADAAPLTLRLRPGAAKTVGRAPQADFIVDATRVSRVHCRVTVSQSGELAIEDLGSTNGTFVNGRRVDRAVLVAGDTVTIGGVSLAVHHTDG